MSDDIDNEAVLLLLGKTGVGKSSTGNTILGREEFKVSDDVESDTLKSSLGWTRRHGRVIRVLDGPGMFNTRLSNGGAAEKMSKDIISSFMLCPQGFHSLLLVMKNGNRFTDEDMNSVNALKKIFGQDFFRDFCIIVVTHGDSFDLQNRKFPGRTFQDWCQEQTGPFQTLLQECEYRAVLFHNMEPEKQESDVHALLEMVDNLKSRGIRYTDELFEKAAATREQFVVRENAPELREKIQCKLDLLVEGIDKVRKHNGESADLFQVLDDIEADAGGLLKEIEKEDKGTGVLSSMNQTVHCIMREVSFFRKAENSKNALEQMEAELDKTRAELKKVQESSKEALIRAVGSALVEILTVVIQGVAGIMLARASSGV